MAGSAKQACEYEQSADDLKAGFHMQIEITFCFQLPGYGCGFIRTDPARTCNAIRQSVICGRNSVSAKVVKADAANELALVKAEGRFAALPVAARRG
jgi:hypothetical protein